MQELQTDTYIEKCFVKKCQELKDGTKYIAQWESDKKIFCSYTEITGFDFQHYSMHDQSHSVAILNNIMKVVGRERIDMLSASDLWLLLVCAYSHDIGMSVTYEELCVIWESNEFTQFIKSKLEAGATDLKKAAMIYDKMDQLVHGRHGLLGLFTDVDKKGNATDNKKENQKEIESFEIEIDEIFEKKTWPIVIERYIMMLYTDYIRKKHPEKSQKFMQNYGKKADYDVPARMYGIAGEVNLMHGKDFQDIFASLHKTEEGFEDNHMHPQFAAAMLRLGDLLDMDSNRFNIRMIKHMGIIPSDSMLHMEKHKSMSHLAYTEEAIEAEAMSDDLEVCRVTNQWFQWLDQEVKDLICCWNQITPTELYGNRLGKCSLKIYYKDEVFDSSKENKVAVDPVRVNEMLIGNNIYKSRLDFIREYLQNALDASKMQLWLQLKEQKEIWKEHTIDSVTPYDIAKNWYEQYAVEVEADIDWQKQSIRLTFQDHGIGMEKDCVKALSNVAGDSWRKRSLYAEEIPQMPPWLRPTGGFGIGVQSAFMMADVVEFVTRAETETNGRFIRMESSHRGGLISEYTDKNAKRGTKATIEVTILDFFDAVMKDESLDLENLEGNLFDKNEISKVVLKILEDYLKGTAKYSLFPIKIKCRDGSERSIRMEWSHEFDRETEIVLEEEKVELEIAGNKWNIKYAVTETQIIVWDYDYGRMIVCTVDMEGENRCYYKGVLISDECISTADNYSMEIIYFGKSVADYLTVNRDGFQASKKDFFVEELKKCRRLYTSLLVYRLNKCEKSRVFVEMAQNVLVLYGLKEIKLTKKQYGKILSVAPKEITVWRINAGAFEEVSEKDLFEKDWINSGIWVGDMRKFPFVFYCDCEEPKDDSYIQLKQIENTLLKQTKCLAKGETPESFDYEIEENICWNLLNSTQYIITEENVCKLLEQYKTLHSHMNIYDGERFDMRIVCLGKSVNADKKNTKMKGLDIRQFVSEKMKGIMETETFPIVLGSTGTKNGKNAELWVSKIFPNARFYSLDEDCIQGWEQRADMSYFILPITSQTWSYLDGEYNTNGELPKVKYDANVKCEEDLNFFINWVHKYQISKTKLKRFEIKERYLNLLDSVYNWYFKDR